MSLKLNPNVIPLKITRKKFVPNLDKIQSTTQKLNEFLQSQKMKKINADNTQPKITKIIAKEKISVFHQSTNDQYDDQDVTFR